MLANSSKNFEVLFKAPPCFIPMPAKQATQEKASRACVAAYKAIRLCQRNRRHVFRKFPPRACYPECQLLTRPEILQYTFNDFDSGTLSLGAANRKSVNINCCLFKIPACDFTLTGRSSGAINKIASAGPSKKDCRRKSFAQRTVPGESADCTGASLTRGGSSPCLRL